MIVGLSGICDAESKLLLVKMGYYFKRERLNAGKELLNQVEYNETVRDSIWKDLGTEYDYSSELGNISVPVISIKGLHDRVVTPEYIREGERRIPNVQVIERDEGHFLWDFPDC